MKIFEFSRSVSKVLAVAVIALLMIGCFCDFADAFALAKKPAQVKKFTLKKLSSTKVKLKWKKVKGAKKYLVMVKIGKAKYKKAKVTKKTAFTYKAKKSGLHVFRVRALKGKLKGKYSKPRKARFKVSNSKANAASTSNDNSDIKSSASIKVSGPATVGEGTRVKYTLTGISKNSVKSVKWDGLPDYKYTQSGLDITIEIPDGRRGSYFWLSAIVTDTKDKKHYSDDLGVSVVENPERPATYFGDVSSSREYYIEKDGELSDSGICSISFEIPTNGGVNWVKRNFGIKVEDVTPNAYRQVFTKLEYDTEVLFRTDYRARYGYKRGFPSDAQAIMVVNIKAYPGVQAIKLTEKNGKTFGNEESTKLKKFYLFPNETYYTSDSVEKYYEFYDTLYRQVRERVEKKIWTSDMDNLDKLYALAHYIKNTTHYPGEIISKKNNPTFWKDWAVDDIQLMYYMCDRPRLNSIMKLQGGITTCVAANVLSKAAQEDLGLPYLYDKETDTVRDGEGVWIGIGKYSSAPENPNHESLLYKSKNGNKYYIDAQGMFAAEGSYDCAVHGCHKHIVDISN